MGIKLPIDTREKAVPGGSVLPSPSWQNVTHQKIVPDALGVLGKAIEEVGYTVQNWKNIHLKPNQKYLE